RGGPRLRHEGGRRRESARGDPAGPGRPGLPQRADVGPGPGEPVRPKAQGLGIAVREADRPGVRGFPAGGARQEHPRYRRPVAPKPEDCRRPPRPHKEEARARRLDGACAPCRPLGGDADLSGRRQAQPESAIAACFSGVPRKLTAMKIGVIGSGDVAKTLGSGFLKHGHAVTMGTPDAAKFGEVVVLAVKGTVAADALRGAGTANLAGKPVIDATNPIADAPPANGVLRFFTSHD